MIKGSKMTESAKAKISASLRGNQYRKGIPHPPQDRIKISDGVKRAYATGRRRPTPQPQNLAEFNRKVKAGEIIPPWAKPKRNKRILASYRRTRSMAETAVEFGVTIGTISYVVRKLLKTPKGKRSRP
jgi:hypothetical protein